MKHLLYAWELGSNLGHVGPFIPLARKLFDAGMRVHFALARPRAASKILLKEGFTWTQAPRMPDQHPNDIPLNYFDILLHFGYGNADDLISLVVAWRELIKLSAASLVLADHAPSAILAAKTLGVPVMLHSSAFCVPPSTQFCPSLRPWEKVSEAQLRRIDERALHSINSCLGFFNVDPIQKPHQLFEVEEAGLMTYEELDPYRYQRVSQTRYWGYTSSIIRSPPRWNINDAPKIFVYAKGKHPNFFNLLRILEKLEVNVLAVATDLTDAQTETYNTQNLRFTNQPVDLNELTKSAALCVILGGGQGTAQICLMNGLPIVLIPDSLESFLLGAALENLNAGKLCLVERLVDDLANCVNTLLSEQVYKQSAVRLSRKYSHPTPGVVTDNMFARVVELMTGS